MRFLTPYAPVAAAAFIAFAAATMGCRNSSTTTPGAAEASIPSLAEAPAAPPSAQTLALFEPNEAGRIPIVMYHAIGGPSVGGVRYDRMGLNISPATFRRHLQLMHAAGWYPVNMRDVLTAKIDVPAGKTPVVLTFDDGRGSQFRYRKDGTMDPECAVAILEAFHRKHPQDWPRRASFYLMPGPFMQGESVTKKLRYLVDNGYELANHSTTHRMMGRMNAQTLRWEMRQSYAYVKARVPEATMDTMALPGGDMPRNRALWDCLLRDADKTKPSYRNRCILLAWGGPSYPPAHKKFDHRQITRIGVNPGEVETWIERLKRGKGYPRYISDGKKNFVSVPRVRNKDIDRSRLGGATLIVYDPGLPIREQKQHTQR